MYSKNSTSPSDNPGFDWTRQQFPVRLCFAMTIHKSQGQTLKKVDLYLPAPVFALGQLYVALSRVGSPKDLSVYIVESGEKTHHKSAEGSFTKNVVFMDIEL